jgi:hypothetical protein
MRGCVRALALALFAGLGCAPMFAADGVPPASGLTVRVDWQEPGYLPRRFRNHCAFDNFSGRPYCSDHCGIDYQLYFCSGISFGCCHVGHGYCDFSGVVRCYP